MEKKVNGIDKYSINIRTYTGKGYYEWYAISVLRSIDKKYKRLFHYKKEGSPDWQSKNLSISVEVTRAYNKKERDYNSFISQYFSHLDLFYQLHVDEQLYWLNTFSIKIVDGRIIETEETISKIYSDHDPIQAVIDLIEFKLSKLNSKSFIAHKINDLFIFCDAIFCGHQILLSKLNSLYSATNGRVFDRIFIKYDDSLLIYKNGLIEEQIISLNKLKKIKTIAKKNENDY